MNVDKRNKIIGKVVINIAGFVMIYMSIIAFNGFINGYRTDISSWVYIFFFGLPLLGFGTYILLSPLKEVLGGKFSVALEYMVFPLVYPFKLLSLIMPYYTFAMTFLLSMGFLVLIPVYSWKLFSWLGIVSDGQEKPFAYISLNITFIVINYFGQSIARLSLWSLKYPLGSTKSLIALKPKWVRLYIYVVAAGAYLLSNVEKFVEHEVFHAVWWGIYKSILIETLLTYIIIDTAIHIWKDNIGPKVLSDKE